VVNHAGWKKDATKNQRKRASSAGGGSLGERGFGRHVLGHLRWDGRKLVAAVVSQRKISRGDEVASSWRGSEGAGYRKYQGEWKQAGWKIFTLVGKIWGGESDSYSLCKFEGGGCCEKTTIRLVRLGDQKKD